MVSIRVVLSDDIAAKLTDLAHREYRVPKQQAAVLIRERLEEIEARGSESRPGRPRAAQVDATERRDR